MDRTSDVINSDRPRTLSQVPGWLSPTDRALFEYLLAEQARTGPPGDLVELGVYLGKSAIVIGRHLREGETFTVCDLFDFARAEQSVLPGVRQTYADLTQAAFERNYLAFHDKLPVVIRGMTSVILDHVAPGSCRFVHVDASHMYAHVRGDLQAAKKMLRDDGIVVFDDYRTAHTPGTAAAVWEGMANDGLRVVCVSDHKFYGTWGDPAPYHEGLLAWIRDRNDYRHDIQDVMGQQLIRVYPQKKPPTILNDKRLRRVAVAILPPVVTTMIKKARRRKRR